MFDPAAHLTSKPINIREASLRKLRITADILRGLLIFYIVNRLFAFVPWWINKVAISEMQRYLGLGLNLISWVCLVAAVWCAFRFLNRFFTSKTFSVAGGQDMLHCAWWAIASQVSNVLARPVTQIILNPDANLGWAQLNWHVTPRDPVAVVLCLALLMFAYVHRWMLDIAQENAEFV